MALTAPITEVTFQEQRYTALREGLAEILTPVPKELEKPDLERQNVFYNPVQQFNRDLSVLAIRSFAADFAFVKREMGPRGKKRKRAAIAEKDGDVPRAAPAHNGHKMVQSGEVECQPAVSGGGATSGKSGDTHGVANAHDGQQGEQGAGVNSQSAGLREGAISEIGASAPGTAHEKDNQSKARQNETQDNPKGQPSGFKTSFRILDALSATGLRALRYAKEVPMASQVIANDLSATATAAIQRNAAYNLVAEKIQISTADATDHLHHAIYTSCRNPKKPASNLYQVVDLDPYGTAAPFIDSAVRALVDGGLLCVTCTDAGVFASSGYLEKTYSQYGGLPVDGPPSHEGGLRLIIQSIATAAARYGIAIEPLLSLSIDFYARIFIRVHRSPAEVKFLASKTMFIHNCNSGCGAWTVQYLAQAKGRENKNGEIIYSFKAALGPTASPKCDHCGFKTHLAGPMWGGQLHNPYFIKNILSSLFGLDPKTYQTLDRIEGMLTIALSECEVQSDLPSSSTQTPVTATDAPATTDTTFSTSSSVAVSSQERPVPPLPPQTRSHHPFFIHPPSLARTLHTSTPSEAQLRGALMHLGYKTTRSHTKPCTIVTDAPWDIIWHIMREWVKQKSPVKEEKWKEGTAGWGIMKEGAQKKEAEDKEEASGKEADNADKGKVAEVSTQPVLRGEEGEMQEYVNGNPQMEDPITLSDAQETLSGITSLGDTEAMKAALTTLLAKLEQRPANPPKAEIGVFEPEKVTYGRGAVVGRRGAGAAGESGGQTLGAGKAKEAEPPQVIFDDRLGKRVMEKEKPLLSYAQHPPNWGPKRKAGGC